MDAANIEVALKNDRKHQERIQSKEVDAIAAPRAASDATKSSDDVDSQGALAALAEQRSKQEMFVPIPDQEEQREIFLTGADESQSGQDAAAELVQKFQDFENVVVSDDAQLRVLDDTTARSLEQQLKDELISEQPRPQTSTYPLLQSFQPVYLPGVGGLPGEVIQVINPMQQSPLDQANLGLRTTPFIQSADLYRLVRMFPDFHSKTLHRILAYCHGDLKRAIDQTLFARQLRVIDLGPPCPQMPPHVGVHPHVHPALHTAPYRIPRGTIPARTHSPFFVYPEDGFGSPAAAQRRATVVQPNLQTGVAPPGGASPLASVQTIPSFQSVFVPVFPANNNQHPTQDTSSIVVPDILMPESISSVHVLKLDQFNSAGVPDRQEDLSTELESTATSSHQLFQPALTTVKRITEDGIIETIPVNANSLNSKAEVLATAEKMMDIGGSGDTGNSESPLLVKINEETREKNRLII